jgi:hypothetical protein
MVFWPRRGHNQGRIDGSKEAQVARMPRRSERCRPYHPLSRCTPSTICPLWPSRSKEQIFYGKEASPSRYQRGSCAVSREKTMCSVGNRLVSPHGVSACATIESIFPVFFCPFNPLRTHQLELTVNLRPNAPGGPICGCFGGSAKSTCQGMWASFSSCATFIN